MSGIVPFPPKFSSSVAETDAAHKLLEPRIGAEGIEARSQEDTRIKSFFKAFFEPNHCLGLITESCIDHGNFRGMRIAGARAFLQISQQLCRFALFAGCGIGTSKISQACRAVRGKTLRPRAVLRRRAST